MVKRLDFWIRKLYTRFMLFRITPKNIKQVTENMRQKRDDEIRSLYASYKRNKLTGYTLEKIAGDYGLTKQRVWQIINDEPKEDYE